MSEFRMPSLGADMEAGTLVEWLIATGDGFASGDIIAVVETQKGAIDIEVFDDGVMVELIVPVDTEVPVAATLAVYRTPDESDEAIATQIAAARATPAEAPEPAPEPAPGSGTAPSPTDTSDQSRARISPRARRLAAKLGVDASTLRGSGPQGSITGEDIEAAAATATKPEPPARDTMREAIAATMVRSKREIPHYYLGHLVDLEPALTWLEAHNAGRSIDERVLPIALFMRAVARALAQHPSLNGTWRDGFVPGEGLHIGLAVSLRGGGLVNPALRDADQGSLVELGARIRELSTRARRGGPRGSELGCATLTVTSLGDRGVDEVFGIIEPPQVAIVGFGTTRARPLVVDGQVLPRRSTKLGLSADHRASDGHSGARFLRAIEAALLNPEDL